jgi:hypothetical protein
MAQSTPNADGSRDISHLLGGMHCVGEWSPRPNYGSDSGATVDYLRDILNEPPFVIVEIVLDVVSAPIGLALAAKEIYNDPRNRWNYLALAPGIPASIVRYGDEAVELTGQVHHVISRKVHRALEEHPNLKGLYEFRDPCITTQAKDLVSHRGYQGWHRDLDKEVGAWIGKNQSATQEQFEQYLRDRYSKPDLLDRFPNGLTDEP